MHLNKLQIISTVYDYPVSQLGISPDGRILGAVTSDGRVVHWGLAVTGPLLHLSVVTTLPSCAHSPPSAVPSISITSTTAIIGTSPGGQFFFHQAFNKGLVCGSNRCEVKAVVAHGERFYLAGVQGPADSIEIVAYSSNWIDLTLDELPKTPPAEAGPLEAVPPESPLIFFAFIMAAVSLRGILHWSIALLMNFLTGLEGCELIHSGSNYPPMIRYRALSYVIKQIAYVLHITQFLFIFVAKLLLKYI
ncbi:hypothetical protein FRC12_008058 [Ceratobasidium sp. 428]|nr:hypothetical protein FRC12_008058 [Ceratobasidium sp. 428]